MALNFNDLKPQELCVVSLGKHFSAHSQELFI